MARPTQDPKIIIYEIDEYLQNMPTDKILEIAFDRNDGHVPGEFSTTEILIRIVILKEYPE